MQGLVDNWSHGDALAVAADAFCVAVIAGCLVSAGRFLLAGSAWGCFLFTVAAGAVFAVRFGRPR